MSERAEMDKNLEASAIAGQEMEKLMLSYMPHPCHPAARQFVEACHRDERARWLAEVEKMMGESDGCNYGWDSALQELRERMTK